MDWWQYALVGYGAIGLLIAAMVVVGGLRGARGKVAISARFVATLVLGALGFALFWPLIALPILLVMRKLRKHGHALGDLADLNAMVGKPPGRVVDVEKK